MKSSVFLTVTNTLALTFLSLMLYGHKSALAGILTRVEIIEQSGTIEVTEEIKTATGSVTVTPPGGPPQTIVMPPTGGKIELFLPENGIADAGAMARVDLDTQKKAHGWLYKTNSGFTAFAESDIHKEQTVTSIEVSEFIRRVTYFKDPNQIICLHLGDDVEGSIDFQLSLTDDASGTTLFSSTTTVNSNSPDIVQDDTGLLTWTKTSGFFDGMVDGQQLPGVPAPFSNDMWILDPFSLTFDTPVTLNTGETFTSNIGAVSSSSGTVSNGDGFIGVSDTTVPEPTSTLSLFFLGILGTGVTLKRKLGV